MAQRVLEDGSAALKAAATQVDNHVVAAVRAIAACEGRLVVTGMGKAGFVARKISATFASTGTPSLFLHPADALHGDLGRVAGGDVLLVLSHSGETDEIVRLIGPAKRVGVEIIAITAQSTSTLGRRADVTLATGRLRESGNGLAPTTSTTVMLGLGDALAMSVLEVRGFTADQFAMFHPGGSLGRRLMRVCDIMRTGDALPMIGVTATLADVIAVMTQTRGRPGAALVCSRRKLVGVFTDGDLRRMLELGVFDPNAPVRGAMTKNPKSVGANQHVVEAAGLMREFHIDQVPVVDDKHRPVGLLDVQDLLDLRFV